MSDILNNKESDPVCPESTIESANRRNFIKKATIAAAAVGVGGVILGQGKILPESSASSAAKFSETCATGTAIQGITTSGIGVQGTTCSGIGVCGTASCDGATGVRGVSPHGTGVFGCGGDGWGVHGSAPSTDCDAFGVRGCSFNVGVYGFTTNMFGTGVKGCAVCGVAILGKTTGCNGVAVSGTSPGTAVFGNGDALGVHGITGNGVGVAGVADCVPVSFPTSTGVLGASGATGVQGNSFAGNNTGIGVFGCAATGTGVVGKSSGTTTATGIGVEGVAGVPGAVPIVASGTTGQTANLQEWRRNACSPLSAINKCGWLSLGNADATTTLHVNGSISARQISVTSTYTMDPAGKPPDFAVFGNASSKAFTVTLPAADSADGRIVLIKKTDSTANAVTVSAASGDSIEGKSTKVLSKQYDSLELISNGAHEWFLVGNSIGDAFVS
jgi:hypothetical protein